MNYLDCGTETIGTENLKSNLTSTRYVKSLNVKDVSRVFKSDKERRRDRRKLNRVK